MVYIGTTLYYGSIHPFISSRKELEDMVHARGEGEKEEEEKERGPAFKKKLQRKKALQEERERGRKDLGLVSK